MDQSDTPEVTALQALCTREGGYKSVADALGVNDQSIYQIVTRKKLPSGRPKGIGPGLRDKLNSRYPNWNKSVEIADDMPQRLKAALATVASMLRSIPEDQWGNALMDIAEVLQKDRRF